MTRSSNPDLIEQAVFTNRAAVKGEVLKMALALSQPTTLQSRLGEASATNGGQATGLAHASNNSNLGTPQKILSKESSGISFATAHAAIHRSPVCVLS